MRAERAGAGDQVPVAPPPGIDPAMYEQALAYLRQNPEAALQAQEQMRRMGSPAMAQAASRQMQDPEYRCGVPPSPPPLPTPAATIRAHPTAFCVWVDGSPRISTSNYDGGGFPGPCGLRFALPRISLESLNARVTGVVGFIIPGSRCSRSAHLPLRRKGPRRNLVL